MSIKPLSIPPKKLSQSITSSSSSFKVNNIKSWARNALGVTINLTAADFGSQAFCVFKNDTGTKIEIMEIDPATIASSSITILRRGLNFDGDLTTETTAYKLDWSANETTVQFGTDVPQLFIAMAGYTLQACTDSSNPGDSLTLYAGGAYNSGLTATEGLGRIYIPRAGVVKKVFLYFTVSGTLGSSENVTGAFRLNATTDTTISSTITLDATTQVFSNTALAITVAQGDFFELKFSTPAWVTNPTSVRLNAVVFIE